MFFNKYVIYKFKSWLGCNITRPRYSFCSKNICQCRKDVRTHNSHRTFRCESTITIVVLFQATKERRLNFPHRFLRNRSIFSRRCSIYTWTGLKKQTLYLVITVSRDFFFHLVPTRYSIKLCSIHF